MFKVLSFFAIVLFLTNCNETSKKAEEVMNDSKITAPVDSLVKSIHVASPKDLGNAEKEDNFKF